MAIEIYNEIYPYQIILTNESQSTKMEMWRWCVETFGKSQGNSGSSELPRPKETGLCGYTDKWTTENNEYGYIYKFKKEEYRVLFLMRFSQ